MAFKEILLVAMATLIAAVAPAGAADDERGEELYQLCAQCHSGDATGNPKVGAPSIAGLERWYVEAQLRKFQTGVRGSHPEDLPGLRMRPMAMTLNHEGDVEDVASYVASLAQAKPAASLAGGDREKGAEYFKICLTCHGSAAEGNQQMNAPSLARSSDWYLMVQLKNFREGRRGVNPKDATGLLMRPMSFTLPDEQAMKDEDRGVYHVWS